MKTIAARAGRAVLSGLTARGPERGTPAHFWGTLGAGVVMGLVYYWVRSLGA